VPDAIASRALRGGAVLGARQVVVQGANLLGFVVLARLLSPGEVGTVFMALFAQSMLTSLAALGLGTSLVRLPREPDDEDLRTVLATQQLVALPLAAACWLAAPAAVVGALAPPGDAIVMRAVALAVVLLPLQAGSLARLERRLDFARVARVEVAQAIAFNGVAAGLVAAGAGVGGVAVAFVVRAIVGVALALHAEPWRVGWRLDVARARPLLRFGVPLQAGALMSLAKDGLSPILVGATAGAAAVGLIEWAQALATYATVALMILPRVYVPAFARVQHEPAALARLVGHAVLAANAVVAPLAVVTLVLFAPIVDLVFGARWHAARELFYWLWCANLVVPTVTPLVGLLTAVGRSRAVLALSATWTLGTWLAGAPLVLALGPIGFGVANLLVQASAIWVLRLAREHVEVPLLPRVLPPWTCAAAVGALTLVVARLWPPSSIVALAALALASLGAYAGALALLLPREARLAWAALRGTP